MARKPRVEYAEAFYHVICRGNQRQVIFRSDADRDFYFERLEEYRQRYGFKVYAYVLMNKHVHLLIKSGRIALSKIMQGLQLSYTGYYNWRYKKSRISVSSMLQGYLVRPPRVFVGADTLFTSESGTDARTVITRTMEAADIFGRGALTAFSVERDEHLITVLRYVLKIRFVPNC